MSTRSDDRAAETRRTERDTAGDIGRSADFGHETKKEEKKDNFDG